MVWQRNQDYMIISNTKKFIFFKPRKVAGTSIEIYLAKYMEENDVVTRIADFNSSFDETNYKVETRNEGSFFNHIHPIQVLKKIGLIKYFFYFKFTIIRNPFDTLVSMFHYSNPKNLSFDEFVKNRGIDNSPFYYLTIRYRRIMKSSNFYIRYENLEEDFNRVCEIIGIPRGELPRTKTRYRNSKKNYRSYYDEELKQFVLKKYRHIFKDFNYKF